MLVEEGAVLGADTDWDGFALASFRFAAEMLGSDRDPRRKKARSHQPDLMSGRSLPNGHDEGYPLANRFFMLIVYSKQLLIKWET